MYVWFCTISHRRLDTGRFCHQQRSWNQSPMDTEGQLQVSFKRVKSYMWFSIMWELAILAPVLFKGQLEL